MDDGSEPRLDHSDRPPKDVDDPAPAADKPSKSSPTGLEGAAAPDRSGIVPGVLAAICLVMVAATGRMQNAAIGRILIPAAGVARRDRVRSGSRPPPSRRAVAG